MPCCPVLWGSARVTVLSTAEVEEALVHFLVSVLKTDNSSNKLRLSLERANEVFLNMFVTESAYPVSTVIQAVAPFLSSANG